VSALRRFWLIILFWEGANSAFAFALLGPFAPWMTAQLSYQDGFSIGGPMDIGQGYRWNVPVVTYGYDPSFIEYFGTNGVAAVEAAIQILNDVPPASSVVLTNYPLDTTRVNYRAEALGLMDVKSIALAVVLEQMGLAQPSRFVYSLRNFTDTAHYTVITRNFDPTTFEPSSYVNSVLYGYTVFYESTFGIAGTSIFVENPDQRSAAFSAVADYIDSLVPGRFFTGLTMDDIGGISYLLSTNNVALETLLPDVTGSGTNSGNYVTTVFRPGVDKITFVRLNSDPVLGQFLPMTNQYVDSYITNGTLQHQSLQRVITEPDILFTARYNGLNDWWRTGTGNWVNMAAPSNSGPGVIQPPVVVNLNRLGQSLYKYGSSYPDTTPAPVFDVWGTFDGSTNPPVAYPIGLGATNNTECHLWLMPSQIVGHVSAGQGYYWNLEGQSNAAFLLQTSTDLLNWVTVTTITNLGGTYTYLDVIQPATTQRFFRTVP